MGERPLDTGFVAPFVLSKLFVDKLDFDIVPVILVAIVALNHVLADHTFVSKRIDRLILGFGLIDKQLRLFVIPSTDRHFTFFKVIPILCPFRLSCDGVDSKLFLFFSGLVDHRLFGHLWLLFLEEVGNGVGSANHGFFSHLWLFLEEVG